MLGIRAHRPYEQLAALRAQNDIKAHRADEMKLRAQRAEAHSHALESPDGIDMAARPLRWVQPGEHPIVAPRH